MVIILKSMMSIVVRLIENVLVVEWCEFVPKALVKLILELNPMKSECVQEALHYVHRHKHANRCCYPNHESNDQLKEYLNS